MDDLLGTGTRRVCDTAVLLDTPLPTAYELRARMTVSAPRGGSTDCSADVLFDAVDADTCYAVRLRERTGVRYCSLVRREGGAVDTLLEVVLAFSFEAPLEIGVVVDGLRIEVSVDGALVGAANDVRRLRHDAIGFAAHRTCVLVESASVTVVHDEPLPSPGGGDASDARELLGHDAGPSIESDAHRLDFGTARWADGETVTASLSVRDGDAWTAVTDALVTGPDGVVRELCVGDWYLLTGDHGSRRDLHASLTSRRLRFTSVEVIADRTAVLSAEVPGVASVRVTWSLAGTAPVATVAVTAAVDGHYVVAYHGFTSLSVDAVSEVLCGPLQHGRIVGGPESVGAIDLPVPAALVESAADDGGTRTWGVYVPAEELTFGDEVHKDPDDQPFGMSLRGADGGVQPTVLLPQYGRRALLRAEETATHRVGLCVGSSALYDTLRALLRTAYDYRPYRTNVFGSSLTDTFHNLVDMLAAGPPADDSVDYQGSPSGWWGRAKGFIDIENDQAVRATTTAVLLSAAYLTADMDLYDRRARPLIEFHLSRNGYGWTPVHGFDVYADTTKTELCATPFGVTALGPLHAMTRRQNPAIARLAETDLGADEDYWLRRAPMCAPLAAYRMTGDRAHLDRACALADAYVADRVDVRWTEPIEAHDFAIYYCADWVGLLELYEETGEPRYLDAAVREARRFVTTVFVRPVHDGAVTVPDRPVFHDRQIDLSRWWDPAALYDYPRDDIEPEDVERWVLSVTGQSFEALQTYRFSGPNLNPAWAPHLLRLGDRAGDDLLRDVAHNAVIGRYTNYPGYYLRQHTVHHLKPDFPFVGPFDNTTIYYHHAPAQLGMTVDYLVAEHEVRSGGEIRFPAAFEENFVWFRFRTYGHRPGTFYGHDDMWLWMPRGVVTVDDASVNWLAARSGDGALFGLSLTNTSASPRRVTVSFGDVLGIDPASSRTVTVIADGVASEAVLRGRSLEVEVSGHGLTAVVLPAAGLPLVPMHRTPPVPADDVGFRFDDETPVGAVRGLLLARPDGSGWDAYVQSRCATPAVLRWSLDGGVTWTETPKPVHPAEWTVRVPASASSFTYEVVDASGACADPVTLHPWRGVLRSAASPLS
ncbi:MAG: hypothetical protein GEV10_29825 [Streptosporangiales bacterium]|nr:hypothetical protein [Streptosporangiales bacterium]